MPSVFYSLYSLFRVAMTGNDFFFLKRMLLDFFCALIVFVLFIGSCLPTVLLLSSSDLPN